MKSMRTSFYKKRAPGRRSARHASPAAKRVTARCVFAMLLALMLSLAVISLQDGESFPLEDEHSAALPMNVVKRDAAETTVGPAEPAAYSGPDESTGAHAVTAEYPLDSSGIKVSLDGSIVEMELEDYLVGVVAAEMPASADLSALQAQAVAARTFTALHMCGRAKCTHGAEGCTVCGDYNCCQAYLSLQQLKSVWGGQYEAKLGKIRQAVNSTSGVVVLYDGQLINALYHASSGRATENSEAVFAMALPYLVSVDSLEGDSEMVSVQSFDENEFVKKVNEAHPDAHLETPLSQDDLDVWGRTDSGRVQLIQLGDTVIGGQQLRRLLGLKSTAFTVEVKGGEVIFTCEGFGHGVGMSQYGAIAMAKEGYEYDEILFHYYTGTELARLRFADEG